MPHDPLSFNFVDRGLPCLSTQGKNGREISEPGEDGVPVNVGNIGYVRVSLKEMLRDIPPSSKDGATFEQSGELELVGWLKAKDIKPAKGVGGAAKKEDKDKKKKKGKKETDDKSSTKSMKKSGRIDLGSTMDSERSEDKEEEEEEDPGEEKVEMVMGVMSVRIALRPNEYTAPAAEAAPTMGIAAAGKLLTPVSPETKAKKLAAKNKFMDLADKGGYDPGTPGGTNDDGAGALPTFDKSLSTGNSHRPSRTASRALSPLPPINPPSPLDVALPKKKMTAEERHEHRLRIRITRAAATRIQSAWRGTSVRRAQDGRIGKGTVGRNTRLRRPQGPTAPFASNAFPAGQQAAMEAMEKLPSLPPSPPPNGGEYSGGPGPLRRPASLLLESTLEEPSNPSMPLLLGRRSIGNDLDLTARSRLQPPPRLPPPPSPPAGPPESEGDGGEAIADAEVAAMAPPPSAQPTAAAVGGSGGEPKGGASGGGAATKPAPTSANADLIADPHDAANAAGKSSAFATDENAVQEVDDGRTADEKAEDKRVANSAVSLVASGLAKPNSKESLVYTFAYWIKWKPVETLSDQLLMFGETRNMPALVRNNRLGALVDNEFLPTAFDPRLAGDNWCLLVVTNDGSYSRFYIGYASNDTKGSPLPCKALVGEPGRPPSDVHTVMDVDVEIRRLVTTTKGAGLLSQAWVWARDLEPHEIHELWVETKGRYPLWKPGIVAYRPPPVKRGGSGVLSKSVKLREGGKIGRDKEGGKEGGKGSKGGGKGGGGGAAVALSDAPLPWDVDDPIIRKDNELMLEVPLASKLAFQRLLNVFSVLVDYAGYSNSYIVIDRVHNASATAELMIEVALRKNAATGGTPPVVLVMDSRPRLEAANKMLTDLISCGFLIDEEKAYKRKDAGVLEHPRLTEYKLTSTDYAGAKADLRRLVSPAGLAWLRSSSVDLKRTKELIDTHRRHPNMCKLVEEIYREHCPSDLIADGRPKLARIWKVFYHAQLYASGTNYIIFDSIEPLAKPAIQNLGTVGTIFLSGSTAEHTKIVDTFQDGTPLLLLESTGGVTQAFAHVMKAVRMMKPKWDIDFVLRLVTEYKQRASMNDKPNKVKTINRKFLLENIHLLDKQLARIDVHTSTESEGWMHNFGLPEVLMFFEVWQRSPEFLMKQVQLADVMKRSAESLLDLFTSCFSGGISIPELGLGNAETKVVATAWNRHLMLWNNAAAYKKRSWTMQFILYFMQLVSTTLSVLISNADLNLSANDGVTFLMLASPIIQALLGTIGTRLRQQQKFAACKMASYEIMSEIYKFRVRAIEYDALSLARALMPVTDDKKADDEPIAPISNKEKDRLARRTFVSRVQMIYTNCMQSEMAKGTSLRHKTAGMDPQRMLMDEDADAAIVTRELLQRHVASRVYNITIREWQYGATKVHAENLSAERKAREKRNKKLKAIFWNVVRMLTQLLMLLTISVVVLTFAIWGRVLRKVRRWRGIEDASLVVSDREPAHGSGGYKGNGSDNEDVLDKTAKGGQKVVDSIKATWKRYFSEEGAMRAAAEAMDAADDLDEEIGGAGAKRSEKLDETYIDDEDKEANGGAEAGGGKGGSKGQASSSGSIKDNLQSTLTIDVYMQYRAMPLCTHIERTAPWRAFQLQVIEILVFSINSSGAVLVGVDEDGTLTSYVAITVAIAAVLNSYLEFSRLAKQVEAYNTAQRDLHNLFNDWDSMTRTERRTRATVAKVVGTVETAMILIAIAVTDAIPSGQQGGGDGDGDGEEEGEDK